MWIYFALAISLIANIFLGLALKRAATRLLQFDDLYQYLIDDIETNLVQFEEMRKLHLLSDDDHVKKAHKNMMIMAARLDEFVNQMEEMTGNKLRKITKPMEPINVTKEAEKLDG